MQKIQFILVFIAVAMMTACGGMNLSEGGVAGRFVQDGLPSDAHVWTQVYDQHGEKNRPPEAGAGVDAIASHDMIWEEWETPVPCADIKGVDWWRKYGAIDLPLTGDQYGGKYWPTPPDGYWTRPYLSLGRGTDDQPDEETKFTRAEAEKLAAYCGVKVQVRG